MQIVKEEIDIDEELEKKINNLLKFNNIKAKLKTGSIISLSNTNIAYIEPHSIEIKGTTIIIPLRFTLNKKNDKIYLERIKEVFFHGKT